MPPKAPRPRTCRHCGRVEGDDVKFYRTRRTSICADCENRMRSERRTPEQDRRAHRIQKLKQYGLTIEGYAALFDEQNGVCAICGRPSPDGRNLHVDHDHESNVVRGLLCHDCNRGLGIFADDVERLARAVEYLRRCR